MWEEDARFLRRLYSFVRLLRRSQRPEFERLLLKYAQRLVELDNIYQKACKLEEETEEYYEKAYLKWKAKIYTGTVEYDRISMGWSILRRKADEAHKVRPQIQEECRWIASYELYDLYDQCLIHSESIHVGRHLYDRIMNVRVRRPEHRDELLDIYRDFAAQ